MVKRAFDANSRRPKTKASDQIQYRQELNTNTTDTQSTTNDTKAEADTARVMRRIRQCNLHDTESKMHKIVSNFNLNSALIEWMLQVSALE